jgi:hypothetical protein
MTFEQAYRKALQLAQSDAAYRQSVEQGLYNLLGEKQLKKRQL